MRSLENWPTRLLPLLDALERRIVYLDGPMGTMFQTLKLTEADYRGSSFAGHSKDLRGNHEILNLTAPGKVAQVHRAYLESGSDIIETNTFNANRISQEDYGMTAEVVEINRQAAMIARKVADEFTQKNPEYPRFVAGAIGPTNKTASLSPDVENPAYRAITFDQLKEAYFEQAQALWNNGADLLIVETSFDTLNMKAAIFAIKELEERENCRIPLMLSFTITDASGRTLSGQTVEAFWHSVRHARPLSVGINCALGAKEMRPYIEEISKITNCYVSCYPNAGLPDPLAPTGYSESPEESAKLMAEFAKAGFVNIVGGCCGMSPDHIAAIRSETHQYPGRKPSRPPTALRLSGLEALRVKSNESGFIVIGERTNVTGSPKFRAALQAKDWTSALRIAQQQVDSGANILDINFDEALLNGEECMVHFLNLVGSEPSVSRIPIMIDSSNWRILEAGLKCLQGKGIVNSISLKEGEQKFIEQAKLCQRYGAAVVVMAFDESGQAVTTDEKIRVCKRSYDLLREKLDFEPEDIVFDPNVLTIGTGMEEHNRYALDFIESLPEIKRHCPGAKTSAGVSNISFSFRGNNLVREAMHSAFLYHAIKAGLDMAIVNAGMITVYDDLDKELKDLVEDLLFNRRTDATERLIAYSEKTKGSSERKQKAGDEWRKLSLQDRITHCLVHGIGDFISVDIEEALTKYSTPLEIIESPLMNGMKKVGELFGDGKMFLPQVVKSARVMKQAVAILTPLMEKGKQSARNTQGKILLATVKGDVHDIGKNIVGVVLSCNNYEVLDLGVMVPCEKILETAQKENCDAVGLSGLITPSLDEMMHVALEMERQKFTLPLFIGGATTSKVHTAVKIAPNYSGPTCHVLDASLAADACSGLIKSSTRPERETALKEEQEKTRLSYQKRSTQSSHLSLTEANERRFRFDWSQYAPPIFSPSEKVLRYTPTLKELIRYIDWSPFFWTWGLRGKFPAILDHPQHGTQARELFQNAHEILQSLVEDSSIQPNGVYAFYSAASDGNDVILYQGEKELIRLHFLRQQKQKMEDNAVYYCLSDFVRAKEVGGKDQLGFFAVTSGSQLERIAFSWKQKGDDYRALIIQSLADRLAEAMAEALHQKIRKMWYASDESFSLEELISEKYVGIRPALGYPACPDHSEKDSLWKLLNVAEFTEMRLTESYAMTPPASVSGIYFSHPNSRYFSLGTITEEQLKSYAERKRVSYEEALKWIRPHLSH